ncbi:MAG: DNA repair protein RadA [Pseudomonadota bacterium]
MPKSKVIYVCNQCDAQFPKWTGQCTQCGAWNSLSEEVMAAKNSTASSRFIEEGIGQVTTLAKVEVKPTVKVTTHSQEFDRVLGGGIVEGSVILMGGEPGIGKSTILLQTLCQMSQTQPALYVTGEESIWQTTLRARRLQLPEENLKLLADTQIERIITCAQREKPKIMVIDSIQTIYTELLQSAPGSIGQVRESAAQLVRYAKQTGVALFLVGHVTKEGTIAGPRVLEHMVDTVLYFEGNSDSRFRVIRATKNRFGAVNELGVFAMTDKGLLEVKNPSSIFLSRYEKPVAGSIIMPTWEGSRPLLVEVQALVDETRLANPRRVTVGLEQNRLSMLLAVLHRHASIVTYDQDVFVNAVGGIRILETAADLPILLSVISSLRNRALPMDMIAFGEVGLAGEIRPVQSGQERLREACMQGFKRAIVPKANVPKKAIFKGMDVIGIEYLHEASAAQR